MGREKPNFRDMLNFLVSEKAAPLMLSRRQVARTLSISHSRVGELIARGALEVDKATNKIPIGSVARYLCG